MGERLDLVEKGDLNMAGDRTKWELGKPREVIFWWGIVKTRHWALNVHKPLAPYFERLIGNKTQVKIADLGSGAICTTGDSWPGVRVEIFPSDMLAEEYKHILWEFGVIPLLPVEFQNMERLTYPDSTFDIVHCTNALDHCYDPFSAILEMVRVCKPGGWVYLSHISDVGRGSKYRGLHCWDIRRVEDKFLPNNRDCLFSRPGEDGFLLSKCCPGFCVSNGRRDWPGHGDRTVCVYQK